MGHSISSEPLHSDRIPVSTCRDTMCLSGTTGIILVIHSQNPSLCICEPKIEEEIKIL